MRTIATKRGTDNLAGNRIVILENERNRKTEDAMIRLSRDTGPRTPGPRVTAIIDQGTVARGIRGKNVGRRITYLQKKPGRNPPREGSQSLRL